MREQYARRESLAVVATALVHLLSWSWPVVHAVLMSSATLGWAVWMTLKFRGDAESRRAMGLGRRGLKETWWLMLPLGGLSVLVIGVIAVFQGTLSLPWTLAIMGLTYPIWGLAQQLLVQGLLVGRLARWSRLERWPWVAAVVGGLLFGAVHWPYPELMVATTVMGTVFGLIYLRFRNLWPLGLWHGVLGTVFFLWVMDKDPMAITLEEATVQAGAER